MGTHMKTTVEISDALLDQARKVADRRGVTLRTLIEEGLRVAVKAGAARSAFRLRDASFAGHGLDPAFEHATWDELRDAAYKGRGA
jgi:predicted DNA-binding ribbon-helix-helix protein